MKEALHEDALLCDVPYDILMQLEEGLNKANNWRRVADFIMKEMADDMINMSHIRLYEDSHSPGQSMLKRFVALNFTVEVLQFLLWKNDLISLLDHLITNKRLRITSPTQSTKHRAHIGKPYTLTVTAYGSPYPNFQWYYNGEAIDGQKYSNLHFSTFRKADIGLYNCQLKQMIDGCIEEHWSYDFDVHLALSQPTVVPGKDLIDVRLKTGEDLMLEFEALAEPEPEYIWYKNGKELTRGPFNTFKICNIGITDAGSYLCEAINTQGLCQSKEITVDIAPPCFAPDTPIIVKAPQIHGSRAFGDNVNLLFKVHCRHKVVFSCFINDKSLSDLDNQRTTYTSETRDNDFHIFNLHYEVNKDDWFQGNMGPIFIEFRAYSNDQFVTSSVKIEVKENAVEKQFSARNKYALLIAITDYSKDSLLAPVRDIQALARILRSLDFRCMICKNATQAEFLNVVHLFSSFLQPGDYVVFYYAGHGFYSNGIDYMVPLYAKGQRMWQTDNDPQENACIPMREVLNRFQECDPALVFAVHDSCRGTHSYSDVFQKLKVPPKIAKGNSYTIYATSENYSAFEVQSESSLLMEKLLGLIGDRIPLRELGHRFMVAFDHNDVEESVRKAQVPKLECDLRSDRSLTDPCTPHKSDSSTVLADWERMSNVGGTIHQKIKLEEDVIEIKVKCEQEGSPKVISNCIDVVINMELEQAMDVNMISQKHWMVCAALDSSDKEIIRKVTGEALRIPVSDLQAINDDLGLTLSFLKNNVVIGDVRINLGMPSMCNITRFQHNNLNKMGLYH